MRQTLREEKTKSMDLIYVHCSLHLRCLLLRFVPFIHCAQKCRKIWAASTFDDCDVKQREEKKQKAEIAMRFGCDPIDSIYIELAWVLSLSSPGERSVWTDLGNWCNAKFDGFVFVSKTVKCIKSAGEPMQCDERNSEKKRNRRQEENKNRKH